MPILGRKGGYFEKLSYGSETLDRTSEGFWDMFEGVFVSTGMFGLSLLGAERQCQMCTDWTTFFGYKMANLDVPF